MATAVVVVVVGLVLAQGALGPNWRLFGGLIVPVGIISALVSLFVLPNHIRAWRTGADGELETARVLEPLTQEGFVILHDRRVPGRHENIDHFVVGPTGVFVIETKNYTGAVGVRKGALYVNGRRRAGVIDQVTRQANALSPVLENVPVTRVVVVHRADFPVFRRPVVEGVAIVPARSLASFLRDSQLVLDTVEVDRLAGLAASRLRPAS